MSHFATQDGQHTHPHLKNTPHRRASPQKHPPPARLACLTCSQTLSPWERVARSSLLRIAVAHVSGVKPSPSGRGWRAARCCVSLWRTCPDLWEGRPSLWERVARSSLLRIAVAHVSGVKPSPPLGEGSGAQLVAAYRCGARVRSQTLSLWERVARSSLLRIAVAHVSGVKPSPSGRGWRAARCCVSLWRTCPESNPLPLGEGGAQLVAAYRCGARVRSQTLSLCRGWRAARCCVSLWRTCPESNPLPLGEGGAQRRVRVPCRLPLKGGSNARCPGAVGWPV